MREPRWTGWMYGLSKPISPKVPWLIKVDIITAVALAITFALGNYLFAVLYAIFVAGYRTFLVFLIRSEKARQCAREVAEEFAPYLDGARRGEWPMLGKKPAPPPDDEGPKAA